MIIVWVNIIDIVRLDRIIYIIIFLEGVHASRRTLFIFRVVMQILTLSIIRMVNLRFVLPQAILTIPSQ